MENESAIVNVEFTYLPVVNYAMQQNRVSLIRQFTVENKTDDILENIKIILSVEPSFASNTPYIIEAIPSGETIRVESFKLNLNTSFFAQMTERVAGDFTLEIFSNEASIYQESFPIDILAFDQWGGLTVLPEMLSSFITPNHPAIVPILKRASVILAEWTGRPSLDEYQSCNPDRVRKQMAALYVAISEQNITYSSVPASFEEFGQRVRLVDAVLSQKLGTCLDMALLYASCLEAIGIHSLIIITRGHAFAGAWLVPETFSDSVIDDPSFLKKRTADGINEITLVETTCMNQGSNISFDEAIKIADSKLIESVNFVLALDVKRSRFTGIRPLPQRILKEQGWVIHEDIIIEKELISPESVQRYDLSGINTSVQVTKQLHWERKLLDLSLRNNLLNTRITKNTLQLISADLDRFEDALADGDEFQISPKPSDWDNPLYDFGLYQSLNSADPMIELVRSEISQKRLRSYLNDTELNRSLLHLYRSSRLSLEENGANTLYMALGLLKWYETPTSERPRYAPLLLLPVEMIRKSAAKGYIIRSREEDAMMNITLLEMLRQNFGITISGLDTLPTDGSGVNVKLIYSIIRNGIKNQKKWDVEEQAILGIFSFSKFIMWNDIHSNLHKLKENKIVSSLISGKLEWNVEEDMMDATVLEKELSPADIVLPINADSSQLEAIYEGVNNRTFILHGPPGTGKSQTITNIIANALYKGKRVLFVAEKMAALSVVQNRLAAIGLDPFCLELHSSKAKKTAILSQLKTTSEVLKYTSPESFQQESSRLLGLRAQLNKYVDALHKKHAFGFSMYDAISRYLSIDCKNELLIPNDLIIELSESKLSEWKELVEELVSYSNAFEHPYQHPLTGIKISTYSSQLREDVTVLLKNLIELLRKIQEQNPIISKLFFGDIEAAQNKRNTETLTKLIGKLINIPELTPPLLTLPMITEALDEYKEVSANGKRRDQLKHEIEINYSDEILNIQAKQLLSHWDECSAKWFLPKFFGQRSIKKQIKLYALTKSYTESEVSYVLKNIIEFQSRHYIVNKYTAQLPVLFGKYGKNENWESIDQIIDDMLEINSAILQCTNDISGAVSLKETLSKHLSEGIHSFKTIHGASLIGFVNIFKTIQSEEQLLQNTLGLSNETLHKDTSSAWASECSSQLNLWLSNLYRLKEWYQWLLIVDKFEKQGIDFIAEKYKTTNTPADEFLNVFDKSIYRACISFIVAEEPSLDLFKGKLFDDIILKYKQLKANFEELTKKEIFTKLASNIPNFTREASQNSEVGILQKNIRNNGRGMSIRKIVDSIPTLLSRMCPCMLMSPMSVAQFIDPDAEKFDLVIFDEASQMPTYEAIGAIARGNNVIVVGDPKQMPPTNFFSTNTVDEDNIEMEDLESILDDCLALSMPSKYLLWHYRSKHESLIAFSNSEYYDNKLLTFPSPDNIESKVSFVPVQGFYDKGKSRQNKEEALAVVNEISRRLLDENLRTKSIGVVTFSSVQQALIEDMLADKFLFNPQLERLALESEEPLFIKNLENVQGDERDVILFSVGYGPDADGKVSMNFGPLNRLGGERRLNVAVSRARYEMIIYSTLRADQIDLNKTSSVGVAGFKRFLEYAQKGEQIVTDKQTSVISHASIENLIAQEIRKQGYVVHTNIGCSGYKIDLGIVDRSKPSTYLLGILCDGDNYRQTKTARDREIVQSSVLRLLGWNICKVWTMDWWENSSAVVQQILQAIHEAENNPQSASTGNHLPDEKKTYPEMALAGSATFAPLVEVTPEQFIVEHQEPECKVPYVYTQLAYPGYLPENFMMPEYRHIILKEIEQVMQTEAPISRALLCKRVLNAWGISRLGQRLDYYFETLFVSLPYYRVKHDGIAFFWNNKEQCENYELYRPLSIRDAVDLPPEEVANGIKQILQEQISLPTPDLAKLTAQLFSFARSGTNVEASMQRGINEAIKRDYMKVENGKAVVK